MKKVFYGGKILTMSDPLYAEAMLAENGMILAVGSEERMRAIAGEYEAIDLKGATMMPGFIDPHSHFFQVATSLLQVSLDGVESVDQIAEKISAYAAERRVAPGEWIIARDYDNNLMPGLKNPTLEELDGFAPENPLVIHHKSGHMGLMNSKALAQMGITPQSEAPEGGRIEVVDGELTGYLEENAFIECIKRIPMAGPEQLVDAFVRAQRKYASYGITTVQDGMVVSQMLPMYELLIQKKLLDLDVMLYPNLESYGDTQQMLHGLPPQSRVKVGGVKLFLDGSPQGRTAWMRRPYQGSADYCGYGTQTDENVIDAFEQAGRLGVQLIAHCNGDMAAEQFLRCLEIAQEHCPNLKELRPVLIHGQLLGVDQLPRLRQLGAMVSFFVAHVYHWGDVHLRNFGKERASRISPAASALRENVPFTFHQDAPVIEPDMMETVWCAVERKTKKGVFLGSEEQISVMDALRAITVSGAYQYFQEDLKGSIAPGKRADLVVLDRDPLDTPHDQLRDIRVLKTYKDGECIYSAE